MKRQKICASLVEVKFYKEDFVFLVAMAVTQEHKQI